VRILKTPCSRLFSECKKYKKLWDGLRFCSTTCRSMPKPAATNE
jgi:hypothetical protein